MILENILNISWRATSRLSPVFAALFFSTGASATVGPANHPIVEASSLGSLCKQFSPKQLPYGAEVTKTEIRASGEMGPEVCIVRGKIVSSPESTINWAVELPAPTVWNGKTLTFGGGGFDGFIPTDKAEYHLMAGPSAFPYVKMSSDSGHQIRGFYPWALSDVALRNHAYEANHETLGVGVEIATQFYGRKPTRHYMFGQSNGGRSGVISAKRFPKDYDGIIAVEPAVRQQAHESSLGTTTMRHIFSAPENWLSPAKVTLFARAEMRACDALDGLKDGVISNIRACKYIPTDLLCKGTENDNCLTAGQIETIRMIYSDQSVPIEMADGLTGYRRFGRGGAATSDWEAFLFGPTFEAREAFDYMVADQTAKVVQNDPNATVMNYKPEEYSAAFHRLSAELDLTNPNLSAFADHGGKLLVWYGLADTCVSIYSWADEATRIRTATGPAKTAQFMRFLTSPGIGHALDGPGTAKLDLISAMDAWVERHVAPDHLVASHVDRKNGKATFQRPVCSYPKFPRYKGEGDPNSADSFVCSAT